MSASGSAATQEEVQQWFDRTYRELGFRYLRPYRAYPIFLQLLGAQRGRLLDVACGPGLLLRAGEARGLDVAGVDISSQAIEIAGKSLGDEAQLEVGNAEQLPFADGSFDFVTCTGAIERFFDRGRALAEMRRVGKPGARYAFMVRNSETLVWLIWRRWLGRQNRAGHQDAQSLPQWRQLLGEAGFREVGLYCDQWWRQRLRRLLRFGREPDWSRPEPVARPLLPMRLVNEFIFVLERDETAEVGS